MPNKLADPVWRKERAAKAGRASHSLDAAVRKVVTEWPQLTQDQLDTISALLRGQK